MPLSAWDKTRVYGTWYTHDGTRVPGTYTVSMPVRVTVEAGEAIVPAAVYQAGDLYTDSDIRPALDVMVPANNDPDVTPLGWQLVVTVRLTPPRESPIIEQYVIDTPVDGEVNLRTIPLAQTIPPTQTMLLRGVAGGVAALNSDGQVVDAEGNVIGGIDSALIQDTVAVYLDENPPTASGAWDDVTGKPVTYPPASHQHPWVDITNKPDQYPPANHTHSEHLTTEDLPAAQKPLPHVLHLNGPEYGVSDYTAATNLFHQNNLGEVGADYSYDSQESLDFYAARGWTVVKVPIRWERIQDVIGGPLRATEARLLTEFLDRCHKAKLKVIVDVHNYGLYYRNINSIGTRTAIGDTELPIEAFADLWSRLVTEFHNHPAVMGWALMAEPQGEGGLTGPVWREASQAAVEAIRAVDTFSEIHVAGFGWSSTRWWDFYNGPDAWIEDTTGGTIRYEAHHYWDAEAGGTYSNFYAAEVATAAAEHTAGHEVDALYNRTIIELRAYLLWLQRNRVAGIVGEMGWPGSVDDEEWGALGRRYLDTLSRHGVPGVAWFAGEWAGSGDDLRIYEGATPVTAIRPNAEPWEASLALYSKQRLPGTGDQGGTPGPVLVQHVTVVTGTEPRPDVPLVLWVGGTSRPASMAEGDIWYQEQEV